MVAHAMPIAAILLVAAAHGYDVEGGSPRPGQLSRRPNPNGQTQLGGGPVVGQPPQLGGGPRGAVGSATAKVGRYYRAYQGFVAGAAKVSQFISFGCGTWLVLTSPFAIIGSTFTLRPDEAVLVVYLMLFGLLMAGMEVPLGAVQRILKQYFFFLYTRPGRGSFVILVATIAWICKHVGAMTKMIMIFNAGLTFYILNSQANRFAQVDAGAADAVGQASAELRGSVNEALGFTKMFSGAFGAFGKGGGGGGGGAPPPPAAGQQQQQPSPSPPPQQPQQPGGYGGPQYGGSGGSEDDGQGGWPTG